MEKKKNELDKRINAESFFYNPAYKLLVNKRFLMRRNKTEAALYYG